MEPLSDDSIMREMAHMSQVIARREEAMVEGFAPRLLSQVELADIVGIRPQSLGALLARLEADGCIERAAGEQDRRARQVKLTDHGRDQAQEARDHQRAFARDTLAVLDDAEKRQLAAIVLKLNAALG